MTGEDKSAEWMFEMQYKIDCVHSSLLKRTKQQHI